MKFCEFCGAPMEDNVNFCGSCGKKQTEEAVEMAATSKKSGGFDLKNAPVIGAAVVVVLILFLLFGGRGPEKTAKQFMKAVVRGNAKKVVKLLPKDMVKEMMDEADMSKKEPVEELDESLGYFADELEDYKFSYEVDDVDDIKGEELKDIKDELKEMGVSKKKVKKAKEVEVEMTMREKGASKDEEETQSLSIIVVKIGRNWYVANMDNFF